MWKILGRKSRESNEHTGPEPTVREALLSEQPSSVFWRWAKEGKLAGILPDLDALRGVSQAPAHRDDAFIHTLKVVDAIEPVPIRRWAALLHDIAKGPTYIETPEGRSRFFEHDRIGAEMVPEIMGATGEEPETVEAVQRLVRLHMRPISYRPDWTDGAVRRLVEEAEDGRGEEGWYDLLALSRADIRGYIPEPIDRGLWVLDSLEERYNSIMESERLAAVREETEPRSPLDGNELLALAGLEAGPWIGQLKDYLCALVERGLLEQEDKARAESVAREWLASRFGSDGSERQAQIETQDAK